MNNIEHRPITDEFDDEPTVESLKKVIDSLAVGKAPVNDGIPPEAIRGARDTLLRHLHELVCLCWDEGAVPQDTRDANIVILYKNKGDRSDCNKYRGMSILSITGKLFALVVLERLQKLAESIPSRSAALGQRGPQLT